MERRPAVPYMLQLDGLRGMAVMAVCLAHFGWLPAAHGFFGLRLLFVLSGYLVTRTLLRDPAPGRFYARRALRIVPAYYSVLIAAILAGDESVHPGLWWYAGFVGNFFHAFVADPLLQSRAEHLWAIAAGMQFYLIWPWVVLTCTRPGLARVIAIMIIGAPLFRASMAYFDFGPDAVHYLLPGCMDALGAGAALAYVREAGAKTHWLWAGVPALVVALQLEGYWRVGFLETGAALFSLWLVYRAALGFTGRLGEMLETEPAQYLGRMSLSLYLVQNFVRGSGLYGSLFWLFLWASVLWFTVERPTNRLKRFFPYAEPEQACSHQ